MKSEHHEQQLDGTEVSGAIQREHERERRRMRDRQRRESMTAKEREKHLARRRRNYQLRRQRAGNAESGSDGDQAFLTPGHDAHAMMDALGFGVGESSGCNKEFSLKPKDLDVGGAGNGSEKLSIFKRKLRLCQVRYLARTLDSGQRKLMSAYMFSNVIPTSNCAGGRKLRVTQVKCLARELNSSMKDSTSHLSQFPTRSLSQETSSSQDISHNSSDIPNTAELDSNTNHGQPPSHMVDIEVANTH